MTDNIERLAVLIEANTKSYENAMKRLQSQTQQALQGVNDNFARPRRGATDLENAIAGAGRAAAGAGVQFRTLQQNINAALGISGGSAGFRNSAADIAAFGSELEALRARYNPVFAAQQEYKTNLAAVRRALAVGALSQQEYQQALTDTKIAFVAQMNALRPGANALMASSRAANAAGASYQFAGRHAGAFGGSLGMLSFQINDIATGLLLGQSPFMIMAQQGGQVFQIWQMNNGIFRELKDGVVAFGARAVTALGPLGIVGLFAAATAAAVYYFAEVRDGSGTATDHLNDEKAAINAIKAAFSTASGAAKQFGADTQNVAIALANVARIKILADLNKQIADLTKSLPATTKQITDAYHKALPGLPGLSQNFPKQNSGRSGAFEGAVNQYNTSSAPPAARVKEFADAVAEVVNKSKDPAVIKFGGNLLKTADAARTSVKALDELDHAIAKPGDTANHTSAKASRAFDDLIRRTQDQIKEFNTEAETAGKSSFEVDRLRKNHELIRAAIKSGIPVQEAMNRARQAGADGDSYATAKSAEKLAALKAEIAFDRDQLGRTPQEQEFQSKLRGAGLDPAAVDASTKADVRLNAALTETKALATDALSTLEDDFMRGADGATILRDELGLLTKEVLKLANQNIIAGLFGGAGGIGGGGGGLLSGIGKLFGFATGGSFTVGGAGGTDSKVVAFRATPGEVVNVRKGGGESSPSRNGGVTIVQNFNNSFQGMTGTDRQWTITNMKTIAGQAKQAAVSEIASRGARRG